MRELIFVLITLVTSVAFGQHAEKRSVLTRNEDGTFWQFTPEQPYHAAAVRISAGSSGGSGTLVATNGNFTCVVTNHHVVETGGMSCAPTIRAIMRDGTVLTATHMLATPREDVAIYRVERTDLPAVAISSENAPAGAIIDTMGFGGPLHHATAFRPFIAKTVPTAKAIAVDAPAISGDSGSGMIWRGVLVGVNWGADAMPIQTAGVNDGNGIPLVYPATSSADAVFLNRFLTQACAPYGCQPIVGRPGWLIPRGDQKWDRQPREFPGPEQFYRPEGQRPQLPAQPLSPTQPITQPTQPALPSHPAAPLPREPDCPCTNLVDVTQKVVDEIAKDDSLAMKLRGPRGESGEKGQAGPVGPAGPKGDKGDKGDAGEVSQAHLGSIVAAIITNIKSDPEMRGPAGPAGPAGQNGKDGEGITPAQIAKLKAELLAEMKANIPDTRVLLVGGGKIIDDETYAPGEPIVLNMTQLIRAANPR